MAIILPTCPPIREQNMRIITYASIQNSTFGGPESRVLRMGDRWAGEFVTYVAPYAEEGRKFLARLVRGLTETVVVGIKEPGVVLTGYGTPLISATTTGSSISVKGMTAGKVIPEGKFVSIVQQGQRFLYQVTADTTVPAGGVVSVPIYPMIRAAPSVNSVVEFAEPKMEGFINGNEQSWSIALSKRIGFQFSITERM